MTSPDNVAPPSISNLSNNSGRAVLLAPFVGCQRRDRHSVNLVTHQAAELLVDQLMTRERPYARKFRSNDEGAEVDVVVALNFNDGRCESSLYQL